MGKSVVGNLQVRLTSVAGKGFAAGFKDARGQVGKFGKDAKRSSDRFQKSFGGRALGTMRNFGGGLFKIAKRLGVVGFAVSALTAPLRLVTGLFRGAIGVVTKLTKALAFGFVAATTAAAAGLALLTRNAFKEIDSIAKITDRLGLSTKGLVILQTAAKFAGIENSKLELGLQRMTRRVSEAAQGMGEAQGALKELGLDARRLNNLSPADQFFELSSALDSVGNQADKIRLGFKLFDSEGVDLIRITGRGIREATSDAARFGLIFNRIDAAKIEGANDAMTRLKLLFTGVGRILAFEVAPFIELATNKFTDFASNGASIGDTIKGFVSQGLDFAVDALNILGAKFGIASALLIDFGSIALQVFSKIAAAAADLVRVFDFITENLKFFVTVQKFLAPLIPAADEGEVRDAINARRKKKGLPIPPSGPAAPRASLGLAALLDTLAAKADAGIDPANSFGTGLSERIGGAIDGLGDKFKGFIEEARAKSGKNAPLAGPSFSTDQFMSDLLADDSSLTEFADGVGKFDGGIGEFVDAAETFKDAVDVGQGRSGKRGLIAVNDVTTDTSRLTGTFPKTDTLSGASTPGVDSTEPGNVVADPQTHQTLEEIRSLLSKGGPGLVLA